MMVLDKKKEYQCDYAALIARDLFLSCDSAGWFWGKYKLRQKKRLIISLTLGFMEMELLHGWCMVGETLLLLD